MSRALTFAAAAAFALPALAQDRRVQDLDAPDRPLQTAPARQADGGQMTDRMQPGDASKVPADALIRWVSQDNQAEIALARFAVQKTQNPQVRQFAQAMIDAHTKYGQKLDAAQQSGAAGQSGRRTSAYRGGADPAASPELPAPGAADPAVPNDPIELEEPADPALGAADPALGAADPVNPYVADPPADAAARRTARQQNRAQATPGQENAPGRMNRNRQANRNAQNASAADLLAFRQNLKKQCGETLKENFDKLPPAEFDKAYASQQIGAHLSMIDTLALAEQQATGEVAQVFAAGKRETQQHLNQAISLLNTVTGMK